MRTEAASHRSLETAADFRDFAGEEVNFFSFGIKQAVQVAQS